MRKRIAVALSVFFALLGLSEVLFRIFEEASSSVDGRRLVEARRYLRSGTPALFEPRAHTVFQRATGAKSSNSFGFTDAEWELAKTPGVPRILCLGASTTAGGNQSGRPGSYPILLEEALELATQRDFEVMNAGISGWTTAEAVSAWFLTLQDFRPDLVLLHFAINDVHPRMRADFRADYSHWRIPLPVNAVSYL